MTHLFEAAFRRPLLFVALWLPLAVVVAGLLETPR